MEEEAVKVQEMKVKELRKKLANALREYDTLRSSKLKQEDKNQCKSEIDS